MPKASPLRCVRRLPLVSGAIGLCLVALPVCFVSSAQPQNQEKLKPLRVTTRLVTVHAVVKDAQGNPVKDLPCEAFSILDEGKPQRMAFCSAVENSWLPVEPGARDPDTYTNLLQGSGATPNITILLLDALNSSWISQNYGLRRVRTFLRQIRPEDHMGIYVLRDDLQVVHDFTRDNSGLVEAMRRYDAAHSHHSAKLAAQDAEDPDTTGDPVLDRFLTGKDFGYRTTIWASYPPDVLTTVALETISRQLMNAPGRKTLIWVTDFVWQMGPFLHNSLGDFQAWWNNLPYAPQSSRRGPNMERLIRLMNDADIAVYVVDAAGLTGYLNVAVTGPMMELASRTGGRAFFNRNDLETGIRRAAEDSNHVYSLAFAPEHNRWNGEWRKLQVNVNRPGIQVLARGGYFALPDVTPANDTDRSEIFRQVATSPVPATGLPMSVHLSATHDAEETTMTARVHMDLLRMLNRQENGHWTGTFDVVVLQVDGRHILSMTPRGVHADVKPEQYPEVSKHGWELPLQFKLDPGATTLTVLLYDDLADTVGSVRIPLARYATPPPR